MFDTMTFTKVLGAFCGAFLIYLLSKWGGEMLYSTDAGGHGHGEEKVMGYLIETPDTAGGAKVEEEGPDFATLLAEADIKKGAKVFKKCSACHKLEDGANATGPYLSGIVGRKVDTAAGFGYSGALEAVADVWTPENLNAFLEKPSKFAPGTAMSFSGLKKAKDRANLIAYLETIK